MRRISVTYAGRVQGVGFRATARAVAIETGTTGWVRNEPDGSVRLEAQGTPAQVDAFVTRLAKAMARKIDTALTRDIDTLPGEQAFEIRR